MQNLILHPAQHTRRPVQVVGRIGTNILESGANFFYVYWINTVDIMHGFFLYFSMVDGYNS
jgi:hypothetical protein